MENKSHVWNHKPDKQIHQQTWRESVAQLTPEIGKFHTICRDSILIARVICFNHESSTKNDILPTHSRISPSSSSSSTTTKGTQPTNIEYIYIYIYIYHVLADGWPREGGFCCAMPKSLHGCGLPHFRKPPKYEYRKPPSSFKTPNHHL